MNDSVYGSFGSKLFEDINTIPEVHKKYKEDEPLFTSSLWGPSCDELDQIVESFLLPELNVGDCLIFDNMGADSFHEPSAFNHFQRPAIYFMMSFSGWYEMQDSGITSDGMMKNFFFAPSCIQLSQEDSFSTEAETGINASLDLKSQVKLVWSTFQCGGKNSINLYSVNFHGNKFIVIGIWEQTKSAFIYNSLRVIGEFLDNVSRFKHTSVTHLLSI